MSPQSRFFQCCCQVACVLLSLPLASVSFSTRRPTFQFCTLAQQRGSTASTADRTFRRCWNLPATSANDENDETIYDVAIIGSGPASCSLAALLAASSPSNPNVVVLSKFADKRWIPNYGCWTEEWETLDRLYAAKGVEGLMEMGVNLRWDDTDCFFGDDDENGVVVETNGDGSKIETSVRRTVGKAYVRVSREGLKELFYGNNENRKYKVIQQDVLGEAVNTNVFLPSPSITFHETYTELTLKGESHQNSNKVRAKIVVDGTGAESPFTIRDNRDREGYQIAYGVECTVEGSGVTETMVGDYDRSKMTLFDFRSEAWRKNSPKLNEAHVIRQPTFNYVMPLSQEVIFFEETSLVAKDPAMSFQECKNRLIERLSSQNIRIAKVLEEEYCYIPMGGGLPRKGQRIVPVGAAAGLVHPSTGYQIGRCLSSNLDVAEQILTELEKQDASLFDPDVAAARIIGRTWTPEAIRQRNFAVFGGEFLMTLNAEELKQFFGGFFQLDADIWGGFMTGWKNLPGYEQHKDWTGRMLFGLQALSKLPLKLSIGMVASIFTYSWKDGVDLVQSVTPFFGEPEPYDKGFEFRQNKGDQAAKDEAMEMLCGCDRCEEAAGEQITDSKKEAV